MRNEESRHSTFLIQHSPFNIPHSSFRLSSSSLILPTNGPSPPRSPLLALGSHRPLRVLRAGDLRGEVHHPVDRLGTPAREPHPGGVLVVVAFGRGADDDLRPVAPRSRHHPRPGSRTRGVCTESDAHLSPC